MNASMASVSARARQIAGAPRTRKILWWIGGLIVAFAVIGFFIVPPIAKSQLEEALSNALHRKVTVEQVRVNPFAPSATLRGFLVRERQGDAPFASFDELYVNIGWTSIFRLAPVLEQITLTKPQLRVARNADQTYNFQDLLDEFLARPKNNDPIPEFALFNIQLQDGQIHIDDRAANRKHAITELKIGIPFISSLPTHVKINVLPELSAKGERRAVRRERGLAAFRGHAHDQREARLGCVRHHAARRICPGESAAEGRRRPAGCAPCDCIRAGSAQGSADQGARSCRSARLRRAGPRGASGARLEAARHRPE
jgi:uncharacterized protein involved in outer membrane biogenesis